MASVFKRNANKKRGGKWIAKWYDAELKKWRTTTGYTDKEATLGMGRRKEKESARRAEGLISSLDDNRKRSIHDHLDDFIQGLTAGERDPSYVDQVRSRILRIIKATKAQRIIDLDPVLVKKVITDFTKANGEALSGYTRNEYITSITGFTNWAAEVGRVEKDPLASLKKIEGKYIVPKHPRRALTWIEMSRLLDAAERRPETELRTIRRRPNKGKLLAKVRDSVIKKARQTGRNRRLAYLVAAWTGLRRNELRTLQWGDVFLDASPPHIKLRAATTKSRRGDHLVIHPELVEELQAAKPANAKSKTPVLSEVPSMKVLRADLNFAGIDPGNQEIGYADLHGMRKTLNTKMASMKTNRSVRQVHMRHADPRLTDTVYLDDELLPVADELRHVPAIPISQRQADRRRHDRPGDLPNVGNGLYDADTIEHVVRTKYAPRRWLKWSHDVMV